MLSLNSLNLLADSFSSFDDFAGNWVGGSLKWTSKTEDKEILDSRILTARFGVEIIGYGAYGLVVVGDIKGTCIKEHKLVEVAVC